jgi:hypothetical protein
MPDLLTWLNELEGELRYGWLWLAGADSEQNGQSVQLYCSGLLNPN